MPTSLNIYAFVFFSDGKDLILIQRKKKKSLFVRVDERSSDSYIGRDVFFS